MMRGIPTGFNVIDDCSGRLQRGELIIIGGRPSMGKSVFARDLISKIALTSDSNFNVAVFSLNISSSRWLRLLLASRAGVNHHKIREGKLESEDWVRLECVAKAIANTPMVIDDSPSISVQDVYSKCEELDVSMGGLDLILIDDLQLMRQRETCENRKQELREIVRGLKKLAVECNVAIVVLSGVKRSVEKRKDKRPRISDLVGAKDVAPFADTILMLYREEVYGKHPDNEGKANVIIAKSRCGYYGSGDLFFNKDRCRFENL